MQAFRARVRNGRLVLDVPTDLPEGRVVELLTREQLLAEADGMSEERRAELRREVAAAIARLDDHASR